MGGEVVGHIQVQLDAALVGDGGQMEHSVGGAAQRHIHRLGIVEGGGGHDVPGLNVFFHQFHDLHTRVLGQPQPGGPHGWNSAVAPQAHTDGLGQAVHGVGRIHPRAGAAGGAGVVLILLHPGLVQFAGVVGAYRLEHMGQAGAASVI